MNKVVLLRPAAAAPCRCSRLRRVAVSTRVRADAGSDTRPSVPSQEEIQEMLQSDEEMGSRLQRLEEAAQKVADLQEMQKQMMESEAKAASRQDALVAQAKIEEAQKRSEAERKLAQADILRAETAMLEAEIEMLRADQARERLQGSSEEDAERVESVKAAGFAAAGGALGSLPFIVASAGTGPEAVVAVLSTGATCFLFGVTYRYAVSANPNNRNLRSGVVGAFGLARGIALAQGAATEVLSGGGLGGVPAAAVTVGESMLAVAFAASAVEFGLRTGMVTLLGELPAEASAGDAKPE
ncbi:unnamed protein product [Pedinophyceae sp. YPF-701]|nr:unnamed protein product [Pedinophyceae sp. YPF-701]